MLNSAIGRWEQRKNEKDAGAKFKLHPLSAVQVEDITQVVFPSDAKKE